MNPPTGVGDLFTGTNGFYPLGVNATEAKISNLVQTDEGEDEVIFAPFCVDTILIHFDTN